MATSWPGGPLMEIGAKAFAERLALLSDGRNDVQMFPGGALGDPLTTSETVGNGIAEMGHTGMQYDRGLNTATALFGGYPTCSESCWRRFPESFPCPCSSVRRKHSCNRVSQCARSRTCR